jgi:hypothetical protein
MKGILLAMCVALFSADAGAQSTDGLPAPNTIGPVIDAWHAAAAAADEDKYFSYFASDAVFLGTDATERWTRDEFRKFAHPYFAKGKAWAFKSVARWITVAQDGKTGWFDEALATPNLGPCRGSGVLVATNAGWKITQYNLSVPIPNELTDEFKKLIEDYGKQKAMKK